MRLNATLAVLSCALPFPAAAHGPDAASGGIPPAILLAALATLGAWHSRGAFRQWRPRSAAARAASFCSGLALVALAVLGPVAGWAEGSFAGHMTQHMILLLAAPPLIVLGRPATALLRGLPGRARRRAAALFASRLRSAAVHPVWTALLQAVVVSAWHVPSIFTAAEADRLLHEVEHASFLAVAILYWQGQIEPRAAAASAVLGSLVATIWCGFLGAILTFAPHPLFGTSLADQQLAGLLMWVPGSFVYLAGALAAFAIWVFGPKRQWAS